MARAKKRITFAEAEKLYPNEWVVFCKSKFDEATDKMIDGEVFYHGKDQQDAFRSGIGFKGRLSIYFMGSIPYRTVKFYENDASGKKVA